MKRKLRAWAAPRFPRLVIFAICAIFLTTFRSADRPVKAQTDDVVPQEGIINVFSNTAPIAIPDSGPGNPYPSVINVSNIPIQIAKVTVKLNLLSHTFPSDIDVLLVGPQGQTAIIMSDVGGSTPVNGITLTLDDAAASPLPAGVLTTGTFQPTNSVLGDTFPAPAPAPGNNSALAVFNGTNPNGQWRLFVFDDAGLDLGSFAGGWTLSITAAISGQNT